MGLEPLPEDDNHLVTHWCGNGSEVEVRQGRPQFCLGCRTWFDNDHEPYEGEFTVWAKETVIA